MFEALGLDKVTERVYLTLLEVPYARVGELAGRLKLAPHQVDEAVHELVEMALLTESETAPGTSRPIDPKVGIAALAARRAQEIEQSRTEFTLLLEKHLAPAVPPDPHSEYLEGSAAVQERLEELAATCDWEVCALAPDAGRVPVETAAAHGARVRTVHLDSIRCAPERLNEATALQNAGGEVRTAPTLPVPMLVADRHVALVPVDTEQGQAAMVLSNCEIVLALLELFKIVWKGAAPLGPRRPCRDEAGLSVRDRKVLELLAEGLTDQAVAHRLAVSLRTARRITNDLMTRLGASSRFEAGVKAALRGWIDPVDVT